MNQRKEYRSAVQSRKWIRQAFLELLQEKAFEKITVTDIVTRADINRSTFYAHYTDIFALVEEIEEEAIVHTLALMSELKYHSIFQDPLPFLQALTKPLEENCELYKLLSRTNFSQKHLDKVKKLFIAQAMHSPEIPDEMGQSKQFAVRISFFIGGIFNVYQQWLQGELDCSLDEISMDIAQTIVSSAGSILNPDRTDP